MTRSVQRPTRTGRRHTPSVNRKPETPESRQAQAIPTPITDLPHLAKAAIRSGQTDRVIWVDPPKPPKVRTPGRRVGQWLMSGEELKPPPPQYLSASEIAEIERAEHAPIWEGGFDR